MHQPFHSGAISTKAPDFILSTSLRPLLQISVKLKTAYGMPPSRYPQQLPFLHVQSGNRLTAEALPCSHSDSPCTGDLSDASRGEAGYVAKQAAMLSACTQSLGISLSAGSILFICCIYPFGRAHGSSSQQPGPVMVLRGCLMSLQLLGLALCYYLRLKERLLEHIHVLYCL